MDSGGKRQKSGYVDVSDKILKDKNEDIYNENLCLQYCFAHPGATACEFYEGGRIRCLAHTKDVDSVSSLGTPLVSKCYIFNKGKTYEINQTVQFCFCYETLAVGSIRAL